MKRYVRWGMAVVSLVVGVVGLRAPAVNEAKYYPAGLLYIPQVDLMDNQGNVWRSYSAYLRNYGNWRFKLHGISPVSGSGSSVNTNVSGNWAFAFVSGQGYAYNGSSWVVTNLAATNLSVTLTLNSTSSGAVTGTGAVNGVKALLVGNVVNSALDFNLLYTNVTASLWSGLVQINAGSLSGTYFSHGTAPAVVATGTVTASRP